MFFSIKYLMSNKRVTFNEKNNKLYIMHTWLYAYKNARKGYCWIQCSIDRERFKKRINKLEPIITKILDHSHREKIYRKLIIENEKK